MANFRPYFVRPVRTPCHIVRRLTKDQWINLQRDLLPLWFHYDDLCWRGLLVKEIIQILTRVDLGYTKRIAYYYRYAIL